MNDMYLAILVILLLLAVFDLIVGVSNDAANFLNSAIGSRAAKRSVVVAFAAVGVVLGASFSSGMMEIARSGVFVPAEFSFHEVMLIFLAVMLTDVILLDMFNTFGMPTSTTVSMVFELLGAAIAIALYKMAQNPQVAQSLGVYINTNKVAEIVTGIFMSVGVAFTCGCIIMWLSRVLFSFRFKKSSRVIICLWTALALTAITYFALFKGLSKSAVISKDTLKMLNQHMDMFTGIAFAAWFALALLLQYLFRVNTLRLVVLMGTAALALAFAGNDLVNFIGVFMAAQSSFGLASEVAAAGGDYMNMSMEGLGKPVQAHVGYLLAAGLIMVGALLFSRKARTVTETEVKLARASSGKERFGSCLPARMMVRYTLNTTRAIKAITPEPVQRFIAKRFEPLDHSEDDGAAFDLIRATVNLTVSALLISIATSFKLPLSTTYVTFMVAMGSSLADRAWGRDSAVYRITGVLTVVGGWFLTGASACTAAFITASVLAYGGVWGIVIMCVLVIGILVKSALVHRAKNARVVRELKLESPATLREVGKDSADVLGRMLGIYRAAVKALLDEDRDTLKRLRKKSRAISRTLAMRKEDEVLPTLHGLAPALAPRGQMLFRITESTQGIAESLLTMVMAAYNHIDNHHRGLNETQAKDLLTMTNKIAVFYPGMMEMLESGDYSNIEAVLAQAGDLSDEFADCITRHLMHESEDEGHMRSSILYLNLLNETRAMVRKSFSLIKEQRELYGNAN